MMFKRTPFSSPKLTNSLKGVLIKLTFKTPFTSPQLMNSVKVVKLTFKNSFSSHTLTNLARGVHKVNAQDSIIKP